MRRTFTYIAGAAALAATLTACGDSGGGDSGGDTAADGCKPVASLTVGALDKLQFDAASYETSAGCLEITYSNEGHVAHTLLLKDQTGFKLAIGDTDTGTIALEPGTYTLYCDIAGHESAGMKADLTVS